MLRNRGHRADDLGFIVVTVLGGTKEDRTYKTLRVKLDYYDVDWKAFFIIEEGEGL